MSRLWGQSPRSNSEQPSRVDNEPLVPTGLDCVILETAIEAQLFTAKPRHRGMAVNSFLMLFLG
jgi:hypothetical protein